MISLTHAAPSADFADFLQQNLNTELLRFTTAGSVDDGKSTLIGRLLHDSKALYEDQLTSLKKSRVNRSSGPLDFSLLTDGLRAEREQGITIDVAYRYFATSRRKFIIADTPGHEQYTRNMVTGASTADLAVILIDATKGIVAQTRRHAFIASLLGIRYVLAAVNKMDLIGYQEDAFRFLEQQLLLLAEHIGVPHVQCVPVSALEGDNIVARSPFMNWYHGPTLLEHLETVSLEPRETPQNLRFPVQMVIRPDATFRGFAGRIARGVIRTGDTVLALPSGQQTRVREIVTYEGNLPQAFAPMSVTLQLQDEIDLSRGDMLVSADNPPLVSRKLRAMVVWLHADPLEVGHSYLLKHTTRQIKARAVKIHHRVDIKTLERETAVKLQMNDIASIEFEANLPLYFDSYSNNRTTGSFILIDPLSNATVGAGMIQEDSGAGSAPEQIRQSTHEATTAVTLQERCQRHQHQPAIILLRNRPALAARLERALFDKGFDALQIACHQTSSSAFPEVVRVARTAALVVIYAGEVLPAKVRESIAAEAGNHILDLSSVGVSRHDDDLFEEILLFAHSLRLDHQQQ